MADEEKGMFVFTCPLYVDLHAIKELESRFNVAHHIYNCFLGECQRRRRKHNNSFFYKQAIPFFILLKKKQQELIKLEEQYKSSKAANVKLNIDALKAEITTIKGRCDYHFDQAKIESGYYLRNSEKYGKTNGLETFAAATIHKDTWLGKHIDSHCRNKLMERAFKAYETAITSVKNGKRSKARFKKFGRDFIYSLEGKSISSALKIKRIDDKFYLIWSGLQLPMTLDESDIKFKQMSDLYDSGKVKYIRIKWKNVGNKRAYFAQMICEGTPVLKDHQKFGTGVIGIDIGPSTIAIAADTFVELREIFDDWKTSAAFAKLKKQERIYDRKVDRQRRINNPDNYNANGTPKKGMRWVASNRQKIAENKRDDLRRRVAETRKICLRKLAWHIRSLGDCVRLDKDSYKNWQGQYGKSIGKHAPGMFVEILREIFDKTGGVVEELNTFLTKSSQTCPKCGKIQKKGLLEGKDSRSIRIHNCQHCGFHTQRDIASALVNKFWNSDQKMVDVDKAKSFVMEKKPLLQACINRVVQSARAGHLPSTFGTLPELERIACNDVTL